MCKRAKFYARANVISRLEQQTHKNPPNTKQPSHIWRIICCKSLHLRGTCLTFGGFALLWHSKREESFSHLEGLRLRSTPNARSHNAHLRNSRWKSTGLPTQASFRSELPSRAQCCAQAGRQRTQNTT